MYSGINTRTCNKVGGPMVVAVNAHIVIHACMCRTGSHDDTVYILHNVLCVEQAVSLQSVRLRADKFTAYATINTLIQKNTTVHFLVKETV